MYQPLVPCPSCQRHVRAAEQVCPFCSSTAHRPAAAADAPSGARLTRAAVVAFSVSMTLGACTPSGGPSATAGQPPTPTSTSKTEPATPTTNASAKPAPTAPPTGGPDDNGSVHAEYGAPVRR